jgi:hypothetical protein
LITFSADLARQKIMSYTNLILYVYIIIYGYSSIVITTDSLLLLKQQ